jgi:hypothetical protein
MQGEFTEVNAHVVKGIGGARLEAGCGRGGGRAAHRHPNQALQEIAQMVLELRQAHIHRGPRQPKRILERDGPGLKARPLQRVKEISQRRLAAGMFETV